MKIEAKIYLVKSPMVTSTKKVTYNPEFFDEEPRDDIKSALAMIAEDIANWIEQYGTTITVELEVTS